MCSLGESGNVRGIWVVTLGERVLLASSVLRPGMLIDILQCTGQPHNKELSGPGCQQHQT